MTNQDPTSVYEYRTPFWQELVGRIHSPHLLVPDIVVEVALDRIWPPNPVLLLLGHKNVPDNKMQVMQKYVSL